MKKHLPTILFAIVFLAGLLLFLYPTLSNLWNEHLNKGLITEYTDSVSKISSTQYEKALNDAKTYNQLLHDEKKRAELGLNYEAILNLSGDGIMGYMEIPKISTSLVLYHGTEDRALQRGIGHVETSALPIGGSGTHCILAGHTGLPSAKLLTNLDQIQMGDVFYLYILNEVLEYRVDKIVVVEPHEVDYLMAETGKDLVTIVTCTPYGINSHRLLVRGQRIQAGEGHTQVLHLPDEVTFLPTYLPLTISLVSFGAVFAIFFFKKKKKGGKKKANEKN